MTDSSESESSASDPDGGTTLPFGELALLKELVTRDQLESLLHEQADRRDEGRPVKIATLLVREGVISKSEAKELLELQRQKGPISGYTLLEHLGTGGMGCVFRAREKATGRELAIKILPPRATHNARYRARFLREAEVLKQLDHTNLVRCYEQGEAVDHLYFAMEFVPGLTLREKIRRQGALPEVEVKSLLRQLLLAMAHYWAARVVHRDIKPENILVTPDGVAKLTDLGLCRQLDEDVHLTRPGKTLGTPLYISPELARGRSDIDIRSDLYSLGATIYHAACGVPPFESAAPAELLQAHVETPPTPPRAKNSRLSEGIEQVLLALLEKERDDRPSTAEEVLAALDRIERGEPVWPGRRRKHPGAPVQPGTDRLGSASARPRRGSTSAVRTPPPGRSPFATGSSNRGGAPLPAGAAKGAAAFLTSPGVALTTFVTLFALGVLLGTQFRPATVAQAQVVAGPADFDALLVRSPEDAARFALRQAATGAVDVETSYRRLDAVAARLPLESSHRIEVEQAFAALRQRLGDRGFQVLETLRSAVFELSDAMKYDEASARLATYPQIYRGTPAWEAYEDLCAEVERDAERAAKRKTNQK